MKRTGMTLTRIGRIGETVLFLGATAMVSTLADGLLGRFERIVKQRRDAGHPLPVETTPATLRPGDAVMFWNGDDRLVQTVLECAEHLNNRETDWRWLLLDSDSVLQVSAGRMTYYDHAEVIYQGTAEFLRLVGDQDGLLRVFEARVRDGSNALHPVVYEHNGESFQINSTGTVVVSQAAGAAINGEVWRDLTPSESDNVYVLLTGSQGRKALALWTTHIAFLTGQEAGPADVRCYGQ